MAKKKKLSTPDWILEGFDSEADYNKSKGIKKEKKSGKTFKIKECPECGSDNVGVVIGGEECKKGNCDWECRKCGWSGIDIVEKELSEDEFLDHLSKKEDVA